MLGAPGTVLAGRYRLGAELGRGGMGAVYRATDLHTGGPVAVKALHPALARDPVARERLRREAQAAALLTSPRVVRVVDLAAAAEPPFLVLEYVAGETLLQACPGLQVLATSRESLGVPGETRWPVPPLSVPGAAALSVARLAESEAVRLFVERAASLSPGFALTEGNAAAVAELCRQLDGIPLALELAAARVRTLSVEQIAARLDRRLRLLTSDRRAAPPHQQTLRASLDWSYDLLAEPERRLLGRLSVFAGGWTLEAAEAVCAGPVSSAVSPTPETPETPESRPLAPEPLAPEPLAPEPLAPEDVLDVLAGLVDKSLVVAGDGGTGGTGGAGGEQRYGLLETVRQYAGEKLEAGADGAATRARHAASFLDLVEAAEPALNGPQQAAWLARLDAEHENLRAALAWALGEDGSPQRAAQLLEESRALRRALGDRRGIAEALDNLGRVALAREDWPRATALLGESLSLWGELGERPSVPLTLEDLASAAAAAGQPERAARLWGAAEALRATLGVPMAPQRRQGHTAAAAGARAGAGAARFDQAWAEGRAMTIDEAVAYALSSGAAGGIFTAGPAATEDTDGTAPATAAPPASSASAGTGGPG